MPFPEYELQIGRNKVTIVLSDATAEQAKQAFFDCCVKCKRLGRGCTGILTLDTSVAPHADLSVNASFRGVPCEVDKKLPQLEIKTP